MECAKLILTKCPSLLWSQNIKGDTALHVAARLNSYPMTELLLQQEEKSNAESGVMLESGGSLERSRSLVRVLNKVKDTALHEAARNCRKDGSFMISRDKIGERLIKADPEYEYMANAAGETLLYLAAENPYKDSSMVKLILETWPSAAHDGPDGMTALHAAVMCDNQDVVKILLAKEPLIIAGQADKKGWTALQYAVSTLFYSGAVVARLIHDSRLALRQDENGMTPLHVAALNSDWSTFHLLIKSCPECQEVVDNKGHNFLHTATETGDTSMVKRICTNGYITNVIINQRDNDGNTPLHLAALHKIYRIMRELIEHASDIINFTAVNNQGLTPFGVFCKEFQDPIRDDDGVVDDDKYNAFWKLFDLTCQYPGRVMVQKSQLQTNEEAQKMYDKRRKEKRQKFIQKMQKVSDSHLVVATLIATVAFAAGFALPGGYKSDGKDEGMATLLRQASFNVFAISNTLAMILSSFAVVIHFVLKLIEDEDLTSTMLIRAFRSTIAAIIAMMLAFVTGTYSVLAHSPGLAISVCTVGCTFYVLFGLLFGRHYADIKISF